jgi:hypothetical protein
MDTNGLLDCFRWFKDATALMQSGKAYENLSDGLKLYTAWTTSPTIGSFHFVADLPALFIITYFNSSSLSWYERIT